MNVRRRRWCGRQRCERCRVQPRHSRHIVVVHRFRQIAILDAIFRAHVLVLMMKVFAKFREANGGESLLVERIVVAAAQKSIQPEHQHRLDASVIRAANIGDVPRQLPRCGVTFPAQAANSPDVLLGGRGGHPLREHSHHGTILLRALVAAHNVVVEDGCQIPSLIFRHLREMFAAVQPLLFPSHGKKNNCRRELHLAEDARALQADCGSAAIVVRAGSVANYIARVAIAGVIVSGHQHDAFRVGCIRALQHRVNIGDFRCRRNALGGLFGEAVGLHFQASAAIFRIALELRLDPVPRRANSASRGN